MDQIYGGLDAGRVVGGLLVPKERIVGGWMPTGEAFAALAAGATDTVIVPQGGTARAALVAGSGVGEVNVPGAEIAVRLEGANPQQVRYDESWLRRLLLSERVIPIAGGVQWRRIDGGTIETWVPVRAAARRTRNRRPLCC